MFIKGPIMIKQPVAFLVAILLSAVAHAAEVKVLSAGAVKAAVSQLIPEFEKASGHKVSITYGSAGTLRAALNKGDRADVLILPMEGFDEAIKQGWVPAGKQAALASVGIGVVVKAGAKRPDISSPEALKQSLLAAKSIAYMDPTRGTSGKIFDAALHDMGIYDAVRGKTKLQTDGSVADMVAGGEVEMGIQQISELLAVPGVTMIGPLPAPIQKLTTYGVSPMSDAKSAAAGGQFIDFLFSPQAKAMFQAKGFGG